MEKLTTEKAIKLIPAVKDYIWGGQKLLDYGVKSDKKILAEAWLLSMHKDGTSLVEKNNQPLDSFITKKEWGSACQNFEFFPVLVKLIDAKDSLSVQVHPSDEYALKNENQFGKTEMWYVVDHEEGAGLYVGFKNKITKQEYEDAIKNDTLLDLLNFIEVKKGDSFFIPAGTVHAIGKGCTILEVQQNSNLTYRVYDHGRVGADGNPRELHIKKALTVSDLNEYQPFPTSGNIVSDCKYFTAKIITGNYLIENKTSFTGIIAIEDGGEIDGMTLKKGDCFFVKASDKVEIKNAKKIMEVFVK